MKKTLFAATIVFALCAFVRSDAISPTAAAKRGSAAARADIKAGRLILRTYGFAYAGTPEYVRLLAERLAVEIRSSGGCVVDARIIAETNAYNEVMKAEIARRFGKDALEKIQAEAQRGR